MIPSAPFRPRLALAFTVIPEVDVVHLIAGEDVRYSVRTASHASPFAALLNRCDGHSGVETLLQDIPETARTAARDLLERLVGERVLVNGPAPSAHAAQSYRAVPEGHGPLVERLSNSLSGAPDVAILCQEVLDFHAAYEFNRRCKQKDSPWMWISTGPVNRGYVSPVFLPDAGPCLACLLRHFQRLSPAPQLYEALHRHGERQGTFSPAAFPDQGLATLEQVARWKLEALSQPSPPLAVFRLHVLEADAMELTVHRVWLDPTCPECADDQVV